VAPTGTGAGTVTGTGRKPLNYTGIDNAIVVDAVAPSVLSSQFLFNAPKPAIDVAFSENVSGALQSYSFELNSDTTFIPFEAIQLNYNSSTNHVTLTFPGLSGGILPDGQYALTIPSAAISDATGNYSTADFELDFFVLAGDANRDRHVDVADLGIFASNWQQSPRTFAQ
jgi:hypothetical protein